MAVLGSYRNWRLETDAARIAWLYADKVDSGTNVLSREVLEELHSIIDRITAERPQGLIILSAKSNGFIAGADVKEFTAIKDYDEDDFKTYDRKIREDVTYLMKNIIDKYHYPPNGAKAVCIYVIDNDLARKFVAP